MNRENQIMLDLAPATVSANRKFLVSVNRSAYYFSILISAKLNHLDPEKYLAYLFRELTEHDLSPKSIERILPYSDQLPDTLRVR